MKGLSFCHSAEFAAGLSSASSSLCSTVPLRAGITQVLLLLLLAYPRPAAPFAPQSRSERECPSAAAAGLSSASSPLCSTLPLRAGITQVLLLLLLLLLAYPLPAAPFAPQSRSERECPSAAAAGLSSASSPLCSTLPLRAGVCCCCCWLIHCQQLPLLLNPALSGNNPSAAAAGLSSASSPLCSTLPLRAGVCCCCCWLIHCQQLPLLHPFYILRVCLSHYLVSK